MCRIRAATAETDPRKLRPQCAAVRAGRAHLREILAPGLELSTSRPRDTSTGDLYRLTLSIGEAKRIVERESERCGRERLRWKRWLLCEGRTCEREKEDD